MPAGPEHRGDSETRTGQAIEYGGHESLRWPEHSQHNPEREKLETDSARHEALREAVDKEQYKSPAQGESEPTRHVGASRDKLKHGFKKTMSTVRSEMPLPQRVFSQIIHSPIIEKTSDAIGSTVARPDAILSGSIFALIVTTALYFTARYYGFSLSGAETIAAFAAGWVLGMVFDLIRGALRGRR